MCINAFPDGYAPNHGSKGPGGRAWSRQVPRRVGLGCAKLQGREAPSTTNQPSKPTAIPEGAGWDRNSCAGGSGSITWGEMSHKPVNITELKRHVISLRWKVGNQLKRHKSKWRMYVGGKQAEDWQRVLAVLDQSKHALVPSIFIASAHSPAHRGTGCLCYAGVFFRAELHHVVCDSRAHLPFVWKVSGSENCVARQMCAIKWHFLTMQG